MKNITTGLLLLIILIILSSHATLATPPVKLCDEMVDDKEFYENEIMSNEIIKRLNSELNLRDVIVSNCFLGGRLQISILYDLPTSFSSYGVSYLDQLEISYLKNGSIEMGEHEYMGDVYEALNYEGTIERFKNRVMEIESNERIGEFLLKMESIEGSLIEINSRLSAEGGWIEYSWDSKVVRGYLLLNNVEWESFPEIKKSHDILEADLLVNDFPNCSIARDSYTSLQFYDFVGRPMYMTVALICNSRRKDVKLTLNSDGSYERVGVESYGVMSAESYGETPSSGILSSSPLSWISGLIIPGVLIMIFLILIWLILRRIKTGKS